MAEQVLGKKNLIRDKQKRTEVLHDISRPIWQMKRDIKKHKLSKVLRSTKILLERNKRVRKCYVISILLHNSEC